MKAIFCLFIVFVCPLLAGEKLVIREDWKEIGPALPITQEHVNNPELTLQLHGDVEKIKKSHHANKKNDPFYIWSGRCTALWAVSLKLKKQVELKETLNIRWRTKQGHDRILYPIIQVAGDKWYIAKKGTGASKDWEENTLELGAADWSIFDMKAIKRGEDAKLSDQQITAFGFTDLMSGGKSQACSRLDWIELILSK